MSRASDISAALVNHTGEKFTKAEVGYAHGTKAEHCGICTHYAAHGCELVEGRIFPAMWCRKFDKRASR
jgi:hypothetical protein